MYYKILIFILVAYLVPCLLTGCMHHTMIQQGNIVSEVDRAKLKVGMSKTQVVALLGKPLLDNTFEENRWYYLHTQQKGNQKIIKTGFLLVFKGDQLAQIIQL